MLSLLTLLISPQTVEKIDIALADVPAAVMQTASASRPDLVILEAQRETRNGVIYYDLEGTDPQGEEWELDIMATGDGWVVVEYQRDISATDLPKAVASSLSENAAEFETTRIIESTQTDRKIVFEFFDAQKEKVEILWDGQSAEFLTEEWVH